MDSTSVKKEIFRKKSLDKLASPEEMKDYMRVTTPSVWLALAAILLALSGLMAWALGGYVTITATASGVARGNEVICYFEDASQIREGMEVRLGDNAGVVKSVTANPISRDALADQYEAYVIYEMNLPEFVTAVAIETDAELSGVVSAQVVLSRTRPISFVLN